MTTLEDIGLRAVLWEAEDGAAQDSVRAVSDWQTAAPIEVGLDAAKLAALSELATNGELGNIHSIVVVKDATLVLEQYFAGRDMRWAESLGVVAFGPDTLHDARSITKSVVGALVGIAHGDGLIEDLDAPIASFLPDHAFRHAGVLEGFTLRHALTMTAGLSWDESTYPYSDPRNDEIGLWQSDDPLDFVFSRARVAAPGTRFAYNGGLPTVLASVVERATGTALDAFAQERLWRPLGVRAAEWIQHRSGLFVAASGLRLRPRDLARFGQMMLDHGRFNDVQILPASYAAESLSVHAATGVEAPSHYGYQWWLGAHSMAMGNGGQRILVDRSHRLVVVVTAGNYDLADQGAGSTRVIEAALGAVI